MDGVRQYILSVICAGVLCGLAQMVCGGALIKLLCGLIVTIKVLQPLSMDIMIQWDTMFEGILADKEAVVQEGKARANESLSEIITQRTQAYILTKASELGVSISAEVQLENDYPYLPEAVVVRGAVSPYVKQQLEQYMQQELGIAKDDQIWIS